MEVRKVVGLSAGSVRASEGPRRASEPPITEREDAALEAITDKVST